MAEGPSCRTDDGRWLLVRGWGGHRRGGAGDLGSPERSGEVAMLAVRSAVPGVW